MDNNCRLRYCTIKGRGRRDKFAVLFSAVGDQGLFRQLVTGLFRQLVTVRSLQTVGDCTEET